MTKHIYYFENGVHIKYNGRATTAELDNLEPTMGDLIREVFEVEFPDMIKIKFFGSKTKIAPFEEYKKYRFNPETEMIMNYETGEVIFYRR